MDVRRDPTSYLLGVVKAIVAVVVFAVAYASLWIWDTTRDHCDGSGDAVLAELEADPMATLEIPHTRAEHRWTQRMCVDGKGASHNPQVLRGFTVDDPADLKPIVDLASASAAEAHWDGVQPEWWKTKKHTGWIRGHRTLTVGSETYEAELVVGWNEDYSHPGHYMFTVSIEAHKPYSPSPTSAGP